MSDNFHTQTSVTITIIYHYTPNLPSLDPPVGPSSPQSGGQSTGTPAGASGSSQVCEHWLRRSRRRSGFVHHKRSFVKECQEEGAQGRGSQACPSCQRQAETEGGRASASGEDVELERGGRSRF